MRYRYLRRTAIAALAATAFILLVTVVLTMILESPPVQRLATGWLERQVASGGLQLEVGALRWRLIPPQAVLEQVQLQGAGVVLEADRVACSLARFRVLQRELVLDTVTADGVRLRLDGLPSTRPRSSGWLKVTANQVELRFDEVAGQHLPGGLALSLDSPTAQWTAQDGELRGFVRLPRVRLGAPGLEPVDLAVEARLRRRAGQPLELPVWRARADGLDLGGRASLDPGGHVLAVAEGSVDLAELDRVVKAHAGLRGIAQVAANLDTGREQLITFQISSPQIEAAGFPVADVRGHLALGRDGLEGTLEEGEFCGGSVSASYSLGSLGPPFDHHVEVSGTGIDLVSLLAALSVPRSQLSAAAAVEASLDWSGSAIKAGHGRATATLSPGRGALPARGQVEIALDGDGLLRFNAVGLEVGASLIRWQGPLALGSWEPGWSVHAEHARLEELIPLVNAWAGTEVLPVGLAGTGELQVAISGPFSELEAGVRAEISPLDYPPLHFDRVVGDGLVAGSTLHVEQVRFRIADGAGEASGGLRWDQASAEEQLDIALRGNDIPLAAVASWVGLEAPVSGIASFAGGLRGSLASPRGSWALAIENLAIAGRALGDGSSTVELSDGSFHFRDVDFATGLEGSVDWSVPAREVAADLRWPAMPVSLLGAAAARVLGEQADVAATVRVPAIGPPTGTVSVTSSKASLSATADTESLVLEARVGQELATRARLLRGADGSLEGDGELDISLSEQLLAEAMPTTRLPLEGTAHASFHAVWPPDAPPSLTGTLDRQAMTLDQRPLRLLKPATFSLSKNGLVVDGLNLGVADDEVLLACVVGADGTLSGELSGTLDALLLRILLPDWEPAGRLTGLTRLTGTLNRPRFQGVAEIDQGSFRLPGSRTVVAGIDGTLLLEPLKLRLEGVAFRFLGGQGRCVGSVDLEPEVPVLALDGTVTNLELPLFTGLSPRLGGTVSLVGPVDNLELSGSVQVERAALRRNDTLEAILADWFGGLPTATSGGDLRLRLHVEADRTLEARTPFVRLTGSASLDVSGTVRQLGLLGRIEIEEGGDFDFQGVRYEIDRCTISFTDPLRLEPHVDLAARAFVQSYQISVNLVGPSQSLVPTLSSDPPLPENEIFSLLAMGRRSTEAGQGAMGVGLASSVITREINAELQRRASTLLPIDQVRIDPFAEASTGNPTARITVVKQLSPTWTVMMQSNLSTNREEVVVSRWHLAPGLFLEASRDLDGTYAVDVKLRRRY